MFYLCGFKASLNHHGCEVHWVFWQGWHENTWKKVMETGSQDDLCPYFHQVWMKCSAHSHWDVKGNLPISRSRIRPYIAVGIWPDFTGRSHCLQELHTSPFLGGCVVGKSGWMLGLIASPFQVYFMFLLFSQFTSISPAFSALLKSSSNKMSKNCLKGEKT